MFASLGRAVFRLRWAVLVLSVAFMAFAGVWGTQVFGALQGGGFEDPGSESARATDRLEQTLGESGADVVALYSSESMTVDDPGFRNAVEQTLAGLPEEHVQGVSTFWTTNSPQFVSADRQTTYAAVDLVGEDQDALHDAFREVRDEFAAPGLTVQLGGPVAVFEDVRGQVLEDLKRAELGSMPILFLLLLVIFGSLAAAATPLLIGGLAILGAFTAVHVITLFTDISIFSANVIQLLGLGLAIDYALFMVSRFREELRNTPAVDQAVARTMATAGRTVAFSGLIVAISLGGLLFFPQVFLRSMGFGGMAAALVAMVGALTVLPALLSVLGHRINALRVPMPWRRRTGAAASPAGGEVPDTHSDADNGAWARIAASVMRRPVLFTTVILAVLVVVGLPFLRVTWGTVDARVLPEGTDSRVASETFDREFGPNAANPIDVVVQGADGSELEGYLDRLRDLPGVAGAELAGAADGTTRVAVGYTAPAISSEARELVERVRDVPAPPGSEVLVGGQSAEMVDMLSSLGRALPWMALFIAIVMFTLLFLAFGSVILPLKAIVMNVLSLTASFGAIVWIFQDGNLASLLNFTPTGAIDATQPILMLAIAFGLSMDYEVFLLSRIREQWDRTGDNIAAVQGGLQRTGRIITSAALALVVVLGAFSTSGITFIKLIGVGMVIVILIDATVIRALLVPAAMRLLGRANWWAPAPMERFWRRYGHHEHDLGEPEVLPHGQVPEPEPSHVR